MLASNQSYLTCKQNQPVSMRSIIVGRIVHRSSGGKLVSIKFCSSQNTVNRGREEQQFLCRVCQVEERTMQILLPRSWFSEILGCTWVAGEDFDRLMGRNVSVVDLILADWLPIIGGCPRKQKRRYFQQNRRMYVNYHLCGSPCNYHLTVVWPRRWWASLGVAHHVVRCLITWRVNT